MRARTRGEAARGHTVSAAPGHPLVVGHQPTATSSHCGLPWEMNEDWPATSS